MPASGVPESPHSTSGRRMSAAFLQQKAEEQARRSSLDSSPAKSPTAAAAPAMSLWSVSAPTSREMRRQTSLIPVEFQWPYEGSKVSLAGSFTNWADRSLLHKDPDGVWRATLKLYPGVYTFKFIVDDNWYFDMSKEHTRDAEGNTNNVVRVIKPSPIFC
eukprot:TRINITY_DN222_c0_g1_i5.p1 TRINITY_DN222_c0_g1~~TRINITY_DN222_c0_g1_i5.p1  ORF type:complete len:160 (+),score=4.89 TRINITY_DN222_c0_g1_i5:133-612(+)